MNFLFRPRWALLAVTVPQLALLAASAGTYHVIEPLLAAANVRAWAIAAGVLGLLLASFTLLALRAARARRPLPVWFGPALLLAYLPALCVFAPNSGALVPRSVPRWMLFHGDHLALVYTLLMPALMHGLFLTVASLTPDDPSRRAWRSFAAAVAIPLGWYLLCVGGGSAWEARGLSAALPYLAIVSAVAFLFFVVRAAFVAAAAREDRLRRLRPLWLAAVCVAFPLLGLALHGGVLLKGSLPKGPFGDFGHPAFYVLAAANGAALCLPAPRDAGARWILAGLRALFFPFTAYFFLVFLPYFPLSVAGVFFFGLGLLMLTPLFLLMVHVGALREDFAALRSAGAGARAAAALAATALVLPALVVAGCLRDRAVLHRALDALYAPAAAAPQRARVGAAALRRVFAHVRIHKGGGGRELLNEHVPYLSPLYQAIVLDNLTLSDRSLRELETIFLGSSPLPLPPRDFAASDPAQIAVSRVSASTVPVDGGRAMRSTVELEIANATDGTLEYASSFALPEGAWVGGFRLRIGDRWEPGLLAESRAAAWVYRQIAATRRDPGILVRQEGGRIAVRVFPFGPHETRATAIEIVHLEPVRLLIDGRQIELGRPSEAGERTVTVQVGGGVHFVPQAVKRRLPAVNRAPVPHLLIDCSAGAASRREEFVRRIEAFLATVPAGSPPPRFTLVDAGQSDLAAGDAWQRGVRDHKGKGGFFLGGCVKTILRRHHAERGGTFPVLVVVTDAFQEAIVPEGLGDFAFAAPEGDLLHHLGVGGELVSYRLADLARPVSRSGAPWQAVPVLAYPDREHPLAYLRDDGAGGIVVAGTDRLERAAEGGASWERGLVLEGLWRSLLLDPTERARKERRIIRESFASGVMSPVTSYVALEDEAQKRALVAKQRRTLAAERSLDVDEASFERMSEPGWLPPTLLALALGLGVRAGTARGRRGPIT